LKNIKLIQSQLQIYHPTNNVLKPISYNESQNIKNEHENEETVINNYYTQNIIIIQQNNHINSRDSRQKGHIKRVWCVFCRFGR